IARAVRASDAAHRSAELRTLDKLGVTLFVLALGSWFFQFVQLANTGFVGHRILLRLRKEMFDHLQSLSLSFYDRHEVGRVMSRVTSDVTSMQELLTSGMLTVLADVAGFGFVVVVLRQRDLQLALVVFTVVPLLVTTLW